MEKAPQIVAHCSVAPSVSVPFEDCALPCAYRKSVQFASRATVLQYASDRSSHSAASPGGTIVSAENSNADVYVALFICGGAPAAQGPFSSTATGDSACAPETRAVLAAPTSRYVRNLRRVERGRASDSTSVFVVKRLRNRMVMLLL